MSEQFVDNAEALLKVCEQASKQAAIGVDTEFLREKTYFAKLCLLQMSLPDANIIIDVLAIDDLSPLYQLMADPSVEKILHSCRQDLEVLLQSSGQLPGPVFDTQLAAALCGYDAQVGYARLVDDLFQVELDKSQTRTDWSKRPLTQQQISYAANDVEFLLAAHTHFLQALESQGKMAWFVEESEQFTQVNDFDLPPELAHNRLNGASFPAKKQHFLRLLASWREQQARQKNVPRTWLLKDKELYELADRMPVSDGALRRLSSARGSFVKSHASRIVEQARILSNSDDLQRIWPVYMPFDSNEKKRYKELMQRVERVATEHAVATSILATRRDIEAFMRDPQSSRVSTGWRAELLLSELS